MIKWSTFETQNPTTGESYIRILPDHLEKTATYLPDVQDFISKISKKDGKTYILINAMTSGESFGPNLNGDFFPEDQLKKYHKTFEEYGHMFEHHINKNPEIAKGKVVFSSYNPNMHRVELVVELDNIRSKDILERLQRNEFPAVSMGCKTPSDRCSRCGNRAKNTSQYCNHLKYEMRRILPDGRRTYAVNDDRLTFFDISFVRIPADRTASVITKIAHAEQMPSEIISSAAIGEEWLKRSGIKESTLTKDIPGTVEAFSADPQGLILASRKPLPKEMLDKVATLFPLDEIMTHLFAARIMPTPQEFQRIVIIRLKRPDLLQQAATAEQHGHHLLDLGEDPPVNVEVIKSGFNDELMNQISPCICDSALTKPLIIKRVLIKRAEIASNVSDKPIVGPQQSTYSPVKNPVVALAGLGGLYMLYMRKFGGPPGSFTNFLNANPKFQILVPALLGAAAVGTTLLQKSMFEKNSALTDDMLSRILISVPSSYTYAGHIENKLQKGQQISKLEDTIRKHPFLTSLGGYAALGPGIRQFDKIRQGLYKFSSFDRLVAGLSEEKFNELYNDCTT